MKITIAALTIGISVFLGTTGKTEEGKPTVESAPMTKKLQSISPLLQVADLNKSIEFYTKKLGFQEKWKDGNGFAIVSRDGCDIFLGQKQTKVDLRNVTGRTNPDGYTDYDLHIHCAPGAVDALWKEFNEAGVSIPEKDGPENREYGIRDFGVIDPDGYTIIFGSPIK